jgi:hypothetical protein
MKKLLFILVNLFLIQYAFAQVGINTTTPNAQLDIKSSNQAAPANTDGLLIPKIDTFPATNPTVDQNGMLVYLTTDVGTNLKGFYYWNNATTTWVPFAGNTTGWNTTGNAGTVDGTHFIGTTDNVPLNFKVNNIPAGRIESASPFNTFLGTNSGANNTTTGYRNTAFGHGSLYSNTTGDENTSIGDHSLYSNTTGFWNTAYGVGSLFSNSTGNNNTATGSYSLYYNTTGYQNAANGSYSLHYNTTGFRNTATGIHSLYYNTTGYRNTATGFVSLYENTTGYENTATGSYSLYYNTTGFQNTATGSYSLYSNTTGYYNTANGYGALYSNTTGIWNTAVGRNAYYLGNYNNSTAIGDSASITANDQVRLGDNWVNSIGGFANWTNVSDKRFKKDIQANVPGLVFIKKLKPVTYHLDMNAIENLLKTPDSLRKKNNETFKKDKILQTGFIAQEVEAAAKEIGFDFSGVDAPKNENDFYGLRYAEFVVPLVKAVQELSKENEELKKELDAEKNRNKNIENRLKALEEKLGK